MINVLNNRENGLLMEEFLLLNKPKKPEISPHDRYRINSEKNQRSIEKSKQMAKAWSQGSQAAEDMKIRLRAEDRSYQSPIMKELELREKNYEDKMEMLEIAKVIYKSKEPEQTINRFRQKCLTDSGLDKDTPIHPEISARISINKNK